MFSEALGTEAVKALRVTCCRASLPARRGLISGSPRNRERKVHGQSSGYSEDNKQVLSVTLEGEALVSAWLRHEGHSCGGQLVLETGDAYSDGGRYDKLPSYSFPDGGT